MSAEPVRPTDCSEFRLRVYEYIDAEMDQGDCSRVKAHLDECGMCMSEYERDLVLKAGEHAAHVLTGDGCAGAGTP